MCKVIVYTIAYNADKTLRRSLDSILSQTHEEFIYYLVDNASTDSTGAIIKEYAEKDKRIIALHNETNWGGNWISDVIKDHHDDGYFCMLDADDEYLPDFLGKMLAFIREYNLEVAACGNDFIDAQTNKLLGVRKLEQDLILGGGGFNEYFRHYHQFMRTIWGKVYSLSVLRKEEPIQNLTYGGDTLFTMEAFRNADRVGILAESLHKYYVFSKSDSYQFDEKRITSDQFLFDAARDFLILKCGTISEENLNFLFHVYLNAIRDTMRVLLNTYLSVSEKLYRLRDIFYSRHSQELIQWPGAAAQKDELFRQMAVWVLSQEKVRTGADIETAADILAAVDMYPNRVDGWQDSQMFLLLIKINDRLRKKESSGNIDMQIVTSASKSPLLSGLGAGFLIYFHDLVYSILQQKEENALKQIEDIISQGTDIPDEYIEPFLTLGLKLSAKLEYNDDFIYFKKLQISILINAGRTEEAKNELADWDEILPDDVDFKEFGVRLT